MRRPGSAAVAVEGGGEALRVRRGRRAREGGGGPLAAAAARAGRRARRAVRRARARRRRRRRGYDAAVEFAVGVCFLRPVSFCLRPSVAVAEPSGLACCLSEDSPHNTRAGARARRRRPPAAATSARTRPSTAAWRCAGTSTCRRRPARRRSSTASRPRRRTASPCLVCAPLTASSGSPLHHYGRAPWRCPPSQPVWKSNFRRPAPTMLSLSLHLHDGVDFHATDTELPT